MKIKYWNRHEATLPRHHFHHVSLSPGPSGCPPKRSPLPCALLPAHRVCVCVSLCPPPWRLILESTVDRGLSKGAPQYVIFTANGCWMSLEGSWCKRHWLSRKQDWQNKKKDNHGLPQKLTRKRGCKEPLETPAAWLLGDKESVGCINMCNCTCYNRITWKNCHPGPTHVLKLYLRFMTRICTGFCANRFASYQKNSGIQHIFTYIHIYTPNHKAFPVSA